LIRIKEMSHLINYHRHWINKNRYRTDFILDNKNVIDVLLWLIIFVALNRIWNHLKRI
jgi:hypothetical protein